MDQMLIEALKLLAALWLTGVVVVILSVAIWLFYKICTVDGYGDF